MLAGKMHALAIVLFATGAVAAPFFQGSPSIQKDEVLCTKKSVRFHYGKEYSYNYVGETITSVNGTSNAHSALKIKARCSIKTVGKCQHVLKIDSVELWEAQGKTVPLKYKLSRDTSAFARELQAHELFFTSSNGAVVNVSPELGESSKILNIKKGILSALQVQFIKNKQATLKETDVAGKCPVQYLIHSKHLNGRVKVVSKTRNLKECSERTKTDLGIHFHKYNEKSFNLLQSSSNCRYILTAKRYVQKVVCYEKHLFRPFSSGISAGASTVSKQVLTLQSTRKVEPLSTMNYEGRPTFPLSFSHSETEPDNLESQRVIEMIQLLARQSMDETKPESARLFSKLVFSMRKLETRAMTKVWDNVFDCDKTGVCRPEQKERMQMFLLDAIPHCGTSGCAKVINHAIKNELVNGERGNMFLSGLALVNSPTEEMIDHVLSLCEARPSRTAMLTLGTLIHKFCEDKGCDNLEANSPILRAERWLQNIIGKGCSFNSPEKAEQIVMALKAIGNAGRPFSVQYSILKCAMSDIPKNMSIAALEALRRMPCSDDITNQLLSIYGNHHFDVEIRIATYLALTRCPSVSLFKRITEIQKKEVNKQVGSFVWSHVTNAMESTEPVYGRPMADMIKKALSGKELREFNLNRLRFSRAIEASYYNELLGAGGSLQGHLIYHPNSFFPRSTKLNITVDVLGASINLLEAAARFEGFETLIELYFGEDGYYPDKRIMEMFNLKPHEERPNEEQKLDNKIRGRRSIVDDINKVEPQLENLKRKMDNMKHKPSGDVSVKLFGNEIRVASFDDITWLQSEADNINMVDLLIKLSRGGKKTFTKSLMFLDVETTVPTMVGLPLKLDAKGTSVVTIEMNGKFDIRNMFWGPMAFDVRGNLKPSAVIEVAGRMGVDAIFAEAGVLLNTSMYTSTEIKGNATYKQGQILKFELGAPTKPVQIFNVSSSLFATLNGNELQIRGTERRVEPAPCLNFTRVLGIAVCGSMSLPVAFRDLQAPFFPLSGPASFSLSVLPTDPKLRVYKLVAHRLPTEEESNYDIIAKISTPGATWEREFEANASLWLNDNQKSLSISTGALGYKFGNISASYHNITNAVNVTFDARDVIYGNRIVLNGQYFNRTNPETSEREIGTKWTASYKNYTVTQLTQIYNHSSTYGILSNTTYWPGKYIFANAELSVPSKSINIIANHTCTKTSLRFKGQLGEEENTVHFNFSTVKNISIEMNGAINKVEKKAILKTFILPCKQSFTVKSAFVSQESEKGLHFRASHDNKNREFAWYTGFVNQTNEKTIKTNASVLGKPFEAKWTFFNYTSEKGMKFNATAIGKSVNGAIAMIVKDGLKSIKVNGSALNKTAEAFWSYINSGVRKSLNFNANIVNKNFTADLTFHNMTQIKSLTFNATGLNKTIAAAWSFLNSTNDKIVKFNATALNKNIEALWMYSRADTFKTIKFNASALNKTIESALSFFNLPEEKTIKLNATALNKTVEALWTFFTLSTEKGLKFSVKGLNKSASSVISFVDIPSAKALKFNATAMNKTVEAAWSYLTSDSEKTLKFNASALNKTMEALWTYFNLNAEKGLRFNAQVMNKSVEGFWSYFTNQAEKGLKFNATVLKKTANASVSFHRLPESIGVQFNASALNRSIGLFSKILKDGDDKTVLIGGAYQNYSAAFVAALKNMTFHKSLCMHSVFLGKRYGQICGTFSNSTIDRSIALNITMMNRSAEIKAQKYEEPNFCGLRFTTKYNNTVYLETWLKYNHTKNFRSVGMNMTILKKSIGTEMFIERKPEDSTRTIGANINVMNRTMGIKTTLINHSTLKEISTHVMLNNTSLASSVLSFQNMTTEQVVKLRYHIGRYAAVMRAEHRLRNEQREIELETLIRNGTEKMFLSSSLVTYKNKDQQRELTYVFHMSTLGKSVKYGWDLIHTNRSTESSMNHELKAALMYSSNKKVSLAYNIVNNKNELANTLTVEYLPRKTVRHSIVWYKQNNNIITNIEILPRMPFRNSLEWNTRDGLFVRSTTTMFQKSMESYFRFSQKSEYYDGKIDVLPGRTITFSGRFSRRNGLLITSTIEAFAKRWSQKLDINKEQRKFFISVELIPQKPATFEASWDLVDGLKIKSKMSALKKTFNFDTIVQKLSKTWKTDITVMKEKVLFFGNYDKNTKTLNGSIKIRDRRIGFVGRFDLKSLVASAHLTCNEHMTGWFLKIDRESRNIIFNTTLTSRISGQVVAEMPNNRQLQVTMQRKLGVDVVNESRVIYKLSPEASRIFLTWNTTTVNYVATKIQSLKPIIINETMKLYNLTLVGAKNLTKQLEIIAKKMEGKVKPHAMKMYKIVKDFDYNGAYKNISIFAKNISIKAVNFTSIAYNISSKALQKAIKDLPMLARNASELYKKIRFEIMKFKNEKIPKITKQLEVHLEKVKGHLKNISAHLINISRDLQSWGSNVTVMVGDIQIKNVKISYVIKRVAKVLSELQKELMKNVTIQAKKFLAKVRAIEIRKLKIGEMADKLMLQARELTCDFDGKCTWKKISDAIVELGEKIKNLKIKEKTLEEHYVILKDKTIKASNDAKVYSMKLIKMTPKFIRNSTIKTIQAARNLTIEIKKLSKMITNRVQLAASKISVNVEKYTKPLTKLIVKVSVSIYKRVKPQVVMYIERIQPSLKYVKEIYKDVAAFNKPIFTPFVPLSQELMHQLMNITIKKVPIGVALHKSMKLTIDEVAELLKEYNHTITSNVTAILKFINELSKKSPEEIIDITVMKVFKLVNHTKELVNKTIEYTFSHSKKALQSYKESMKIMNKKIQKIMQMKPEDVVELSIQNIHLTIKNMTASIKNFSIEVQSVAKQLQNLDFTTPFMKMWSEIDLINRYSSLALGEKWNKIVDKYMKMFKAFNLKERLMAIKTRYEIHGQRLMKEVKEVATFGERTMNLTMKLIKMQITREDFIKELLSIIEGSKIMAKKHFHLARDAVFALYTLRNKHYNSTVQSLTGYKDTTLNKMKDTYKKIEKYIVDFGKEHEQEFNEAYEFYKDIAVDIYEIAEKETLVAKGKVMNKLNELKIKLDELKKKVIVRLESLVLKIRQYENMTYEEMGIKVYQVSKKYGLALYKNYSTKAIALFNKTKNMTLRAYNLTREMAIKYYKIGKVEAIRIFNSTKNFTVTYYKISRNMTITYIKISRNLSLKLFNITRNMTLRGIEYLNKTVRPQMIVYYGKGKVYLIKLYNDGKERALKSVEDVKMWYADNKEKTVEELYLEAYGAVEARVDKLKARVNKLALKTKAQLLENVKMVNKTIRNITAEIISVYNQTRNVSIIAGKQLIAIFAPYAKVAQDNAIAQYNELKKVYNDMDFETIYKLKNMTMMYLNKTKTLVILQFNKTKNFTIEVYRNITNRKDFKEFMAKHQIKERYEKMITKAKEIIEKVKAFIKESRPKLEAKYRETVYYLNYTLPRLIKEKKAEIIAMIKNKKAEIMADPKEYIRSIYADAKNKINEKIKDTAVEEIIMHEIWSDYLEEIKQHEFYQISQEIAEIGKAKADVAITQLKQKAEVLKQKVDELKIKLKVKVEEIKQKAQKIYKETKATVEKGFEDLKQMKLREIVEHRYVFKTIEFAKNTSRKIQNITMQAKNMTLKWIAVGKVFYKNMTIKAQNYTKIIQKFALELKKNCTLACEKVKIIAKKYILVAKNYTDIAKNYTIKYYKIARNWTMVKVNVTRMWVNKTAERYIEIYKVKVVPYYKNKVVPFYTNKVVPMYHKYRQLVIEVSKNMTKMAYKTIINSKAYNFTLKTYNLTIEVLRNASKSTPRQTVLKIRQISLIAYNFTMKTANRAINLTKIAYKEGIKKLNATKIQLNKLFNGTLKASMESMKPILPVLNFTKNEIIETIVFIDKYYGIEDLLRESVKHHYKKFHARYQRLNMTFSHHLNKMQKESEEFIKTLPGLAKSSAYEALELVNKTIRFAHYSIGYVNTTLINLKKSFKLSLPELRNYIRIDDGMIVLIIPHPRPINGDIVSICNDACEKVKNIPVAAKRMAREAIDKSKDYANKAIIKARQFLERSTNCPVYKKVHNITMRLINATKNHPVAKKYLNKTIMFLRKTSEYINKIDVQGMSLKLKKNLRIRQFIGMTQLYLIRIGEELKTYDYKKISNLTKHYAPIAYNMTKEMLAIGYNTTRNYTMVVTNIAWNITVDLYNSTSPQHVLLKARNYTIKAYNMTVKELQALYKKNQPKIEKIKAYIEVQKGMIIAKSQVALNKARNVSMQLLIMTKNNPMVQDYVNSTIHFINVTRAFLNKINVTKIANMTKHYVPVAFNMTRDMCVVGVYSAKNFTVGVAKLTWNITIDIYNSTSLQEALLKAKNHSAKAYNETLRLYRILYNKTMAKYAEVNKTARALYVQIYKHRITQKSLSHARHYYGHSMKMIESRGRHMHHLKSYWRHRIAHKAHYLKKMFNPMNWIPPFNSTAVIFGKDHVYTFDSQYFRFPGYKNERCTYVLARDVRDDKFTLMSQEKALLFKSEDANVKIHSNGKVETMIKITKDGQKIHDGYDSELPVQSQNMTVFREGQYNVLRHDIGIEILCDIEHELCTFNIGKWYHGRLAGLLGTNNNEGHDDMMKSTGHLTENLIDFVNSWEATKDPKCQIKRQRKPKKCSPSKYIHRCNDLFKSLKSPLAPFFNIINPKPFKLACEQDYERCDVNMPKDMKHCNVSATYIELLRMKGQWVDHLPECGRCGNNELDRKWFQSAKGQVDVILVVPETEGMKAYAQKIPNYVQQIVGDLEKFSFRFGLVSFGGEGIHYHPHQVTMNGKFLGTADEVQHAVDHLKFSTTKDNETDGFEGIEMATRYPFRAGATKIVIFWTTSERSAHEHAPCLREMTRKLQRQDITLNIIGKYKKYVGEINGQDFQGRVFYRKMIKGSNSGASLPEGEFMSLMKNTQGSAFSITSFGSDAEKRALSMQKSFVYTLKEQIKRDQVMCKECYCKRGLVGEGRSICKINEHHKC